MALGSVRCGFLASAAVVPINSVPAKENTAIWKPAKKPLSPCGSTAPGAITWDSEATTPLGDVNEVAIITAAVRISITMATILMMPNQNSTSPKIRTASMFNPSSTNRVKNAGIQAGTSGYQY
ncbi:hypothetical protein D3C76_1170570 [compost metagenome]